ncbi:MAG: glutamine amidotransferase [Parasphingorhabdus sp.]|jgi:glutamine amidotransferase
MQQITVVDFGTGNLRSVQKAIEHVAPNAHVQVSRNPSVINASDRVVLPGQGAMGTWLKSMQDFNLESCIRTVVDSKPVLGICLGLQALTRCSEEDGGVKGLEFFSGRVKKFNVPEDQSGLLPKIPHMGWNQVTQKIDHPIWHDIATGSRFYFVHSYYAELDNSEEVVGRTDYIVNFVSAAARKNVIAVQFHPEKSHTQGLKLLKNFVNWDGN